MGYKPLSENSGAVRASPPANEKQRPGSPTADSTPKAPPFFFFFFLRPTSRLHRCFSTFVGSPTGDAAQCHFSVQKRHCGSKQGTQTGLPLPGAQGSGKRLASQGGIPASHG